MFGNINHFPSKSVKVSRAPWRTKLPSITTPLFL